MIKRPQLYSVIIVLVMFLALCQDAHAKTCYASALGGNWSNDLTAWVTTDGGSIPQTHPIAGDTVFLTSNGGQITVDVASACATIDCTGYTSTLTQNANLTTTGNVTLVSGMTFTYTSGTWTFATNLCTITSGGKTLGNVTLSGNVTYTLGDNLNMSGNLTVSGATTINSNTLFVGGNMKLFGSGTCTGTTILTMNGTGTWDGVDFTTTWGNDITFNTSGTITLGSNLYYSARAAGSTLTYTAGTISAGTSNLNITGPNTTTLNTSGMTWYDVTFNDQAFTLTLTSALNISHNLITTGGHTTTISTSDINTAGLTMTSGIITGTGRAINLTATGTWSGTAVPSIGTLNIDSGAGTTTISGTVAFGKGILKYTSGTVVTTGSTLNASSGGAFAVTLNTSGITWNNVTGGSGVEITLTSPLVVGNNFTIGTGIFRPGTNQVTVGGNLSILYASRTGWRVGNNTFVFDGTTTVSTNATALGAQFYNFTINPGRTVHLTSTEVYSATGTFTAIGTSSSKITFNAVTASSAATFNVTTVGTVSYVTATDIDSSGGTAIVDQIGTILRTVNWSVTLAPTTKYLYNCTINNAVIQ